MTEKRDYTYTSSLSRYIRDFVSEKRQMGFIFNTAAYQLQRFDGYWDTCGYDEDITQDRLQEWFMPLSEKESKSSHSQRISVVKDLSIYMNSIGIPAYVPLLNVGKDHNTVHIFTGQELKELFEKIDSYVPISINHNDYRMANAYPVMFRLFYCCGMRNNEVCALRTSDVDFEKGIITVLDGKNQKDRLVYLSDDMRVLTKKYLSYITKFMGYEPYWLFPGRFPEKHVGKSHLDKRFNQFWRATDSASLCDKKPSLHCLRHTFVVNRINRWILDGIDVDVMIIYLSRYLGHKSPDETFYYYHLVDDAFRIIRQKDETADIVIPEVRRL